MNKKDILIQVEDYAKKLHAVDYWSGEVKSSAVLKPAYDSLYTLTQIIDNLEVYPIARKKM